MLIEEVLAAPDRTGAAFAWLRIENVPNLEVEPQEYLFLEPHEEIRRCWIIDSFDPDWRFKIGQQMVTVFDLPQLQQQATEMGYQLVFWDDPKPAFDWVATLRADPGVSINSALEGTIDRAGKPVQTINGFLPFQAEAVNFAKTCERMMYCRHDTGMGKTVVAEGIMLSREWDICLYCVKPRNITGAYRKLKLHTGLEGTIVRGSPDRRKRLWAEGGPIYLFNAEKFREDLESIQELVTDRNVLIIIDEMPKKYSYRSSQLYKKTCEALYTSYVEIKRKGKTQHVFYPKAGAERASSMFGVALSATWIIHSPEGVFNQIRLFDPTIYGSVKIWEKRFVKARDIWDKIISWKNLELMGAMAAHVVHYADKNNPAVINQFPAKLPPETREVDLDDGAQALYDRLQGEYRKVINDKDSVLSTKDLLAAISCFQLLCNNPRAVLKSATLFNTYTQDRDLYLSSLEQQGKSDNEIDTCLEEFDRKFKTGSEVAWKLWLITRNDNKFSDRDDKGNCTVAKMLELREILDDHDGKAIVFTGYNELTLFFIAEWFREWGISFVEFHGEMSTKKSDAAYDRFRSNPEIKVFLSTDAGQDSIDLPEASLTIHYDLPRSWSAADVTQRDNRKDRIDSKLDVIRSITLLIPGTVEDRKLEVMREKAKLAGKLSGAMEEQAEGLGRSDLLYVLTGQKPED